MRSKSTNYFGTSKDLALLGESTKPLKLSFIEFEGAESGASNLVDSLSSLKPRTSYLVTDTPEVIVPRTIELRNGAARVVFDQVKNPGTTVLATGGMVGKDRLLPGQIGTVHNDEHASTLYKALSSALKSLFTPVQSYYVGPDAVSLMKQGLRLSPTEKSPKEFDLSFD